MKNPHKKYIFMRIYEFLSIKIICYFAIKIKINFFKYDTIKINQTRPNYSDFFDEKTLKRSNMANISVEEIRNKILVRLLLNKLCFPQWKIREEFYYYELISNTMYSANEIFKELGLTNILARKRGNRIFIFHNSTKRIVCEIGVDYESSNSLCKRPNVFLVNLRGMIPNNKSFQELILATEKLGARKK